MTKVSSVSLPISPRSLILLERWCALTAFLVPLKLSLTYISLIPLILIWLFICRTHLKSLAQSPEFRAIGLPVAYFLGIVTLSAFTGFDARHSLPSLVSLVFFSLTIGVFSTVACVPSCVTALLAGQSLAALHSWLSSSPFVHLPSIFLGEVTESGQLALVIPLAFGVAFQNLSQMSKEQRPFLIVGAGISIVALLAYAFQEDLGIPTSWALLCVALFFLMAATIFFRYHRSPLTTKTEIPSSLSTVTLTILTTHQLPLLLSALVINLKRGPWLGVLSALLVFCTLLSKRLLALIIAIAALVTGLLPSVQHRLLESYEHFTISGGRSTIWRIGVELISEFPMGVGYHNSGVLRRFSPEIPESLKHFHNNFLNITAETGWLGLACFLWIVVTLIKTAFRKGASVLSIAIGCAIISWQVAGLVEYNFGDSEITIIVWMLVGFLMQSVSKPLSGSKNTH